MPTIFDVAEGAGVSIASVSLVLNDPETRRVGEAKRRKILRVAKEVGYEPNPLAKGLRNQGTKVLGLVVPMRDPIFFNLFIADVLAGIQSCLLQRGYHLMVYSHDSKEGKITRRQILQSKFIDGVIFINTRLCTAADIEDSIKELRLAEVPFVIINGYYGQKDTSYLGVDVDDFEIGYIAGKHLCERRHRNVALIAGSRRSPGSAPLLEGFRKALAEHDVALPHQQVAYGEYDGDIIQGVVRRWLKRAERPTAIFCASDQMVLNVYQVLQEAHVGIPAQVAVVGRGDLMFVSFLIPPLTTVRVPRFDLGFKAADLLIQSLLRADFQPQRIILPCELVQRGSA